MQTGPSAQRGGAQNMDISMGVRKGTSFKFSRTDPGEIGGNPIRGKGGRRDRGGQKRRPRYQGKRTYIKKENKKRTVTGEEKGLTHRDGRIVVSGA